MCFFPLPNENFNSLAYRKGVREFDCGACPECLRKRSNIWALRSVYECKSHVFNCMVTLTYDDYERDSRGNIIRELPPDSDRHVVKRDVQLFIKRLRKWYSSFSDEKLKYIACAEYGSRTHRAHYHCILFGVRFPDLVYYKKSKRGNVIYKSNILTKLWRHGICTVDSINVGSAVARYCTKYCAKSRSEDTFMLSSQKVGYEYLKRDFNGLSYFIDGREYPVPRFIWEDYITNKYQRKFLYLKNAPLLSPKYINACYDDNHEFLLNSFEFERSRKQRSFYRKVRDKDSLYVRYLDYWMNKGRSFEIVQTPVLNRLNLLDEGKFHRYKVAAREILSLRSRGVPNVAPGSNCVSAYFRWLEKRGISLARSPSRPYRASDTKPLGLEIKYRTHHLFLREIFDIPPNFVRNVQQSVIDI